MYQVFYKWKNGKSFLAQLIYQLILLLLSFFLSYDLCKKKIRMKNSLSKNVTLRNYAPNSNITLLSLYKIIPTIRFAILNL